MRRCGFAPRIWSCGFRSSVVLRFAGQEEKRRSKETRYRNDGTLLKITVHLANNARSYKTFHLTLITMTEKNFHGVQCFYASGAALQI